VDVVRSGYIIIVPKPLAKILYIRAKVPCPANGSFWRVKRRTGTQENMPDKLGEKNCAKKRKKFNAAKIQCASINDEKKIYLPRCKR
jgi:hypothetical protein